MVRAPKENVHARQAHNQRRSTYKGYRTDWKILKVWKSAIILGINNRELHALNIYIYIFQ